VFRTDNSVDRRYLPGKTLFLSLLIVVSWTRASEAARYSESPMLRSQVDAGNLPPVEERLPDEPLVVPPYEKIGSYGGELRITSGREDVITEAYHLGKESLLRFAGDGTTVMPNVAREWQLSSDGTSITIHLRKGMRWSDGVPVTTRDVQFAWEDVFLNKDLNPRPPPLYKVGGEPMTLEIIDDYTFRLAFSGPNGAIPLYLTMAHTAHNLIQPRHYLMQFHPKYTAMEIIMERADKAGFATWFEYFRDMNHSMKVLDPQVPTDFPTINAWRLIKVPSAGHAILERNPYYWKTDPEGQQLPYIDRMHSTAVSKEEPRNLLFVSGDVDFAAQYARIENAPLFLSGRKKGRYDVYFYEENQGTRVAYYFNQTHRDPVQRKIFQDKRFRIAMSHAINRAEINTIVYFGKAAPKQDTVSPVSDFHDPEFDTAYASYEPDTANKLLDEMDLTAGRDGWRRRPDGRTLVINMPVYPIEPYKKTSELVAEYWGAVGVLVNWRVLQGGLIGERLAGNLVDVVGFPNDVSVELTVMESPVYGMGRWAPLWDRWVKSEGKTGEKPPPSIMSLYAVWESIRRATDPEERNRLGKQLMRSQAENLWGIGTVGETITPVIVSDRLHNVPRFMQDSEDNIVEGRIPLYGSPWGVSVLQRPEQFWLEEIRSNPSTSSGQASSDAGGPTTDNQ